MNDQKTCGECDRGRVPMFDKCGNEIGDEPCESCKGSGFVETSGQTCGECGQPMLAEGQRRQHPDDYRHASGCPQSWRDMRVGCGECGDLFYPNTQFGVRRCPDCKVKECCNTPFPKQDDGGDALAANMETSE